MRTNLEKYNYYLNIIESKEHDFINIEIPNPPKILYKVSKDGTIIECIVEKLQYFRNNNYFDYNKKVYKDLVKKVKDYSETEHKLERNNIRFNIVEDRGTYKVSSSISLEMLDDYFLTKKCAEVVSEEYIKIVNEENEKLNNDYVRCERCRKLILESDALNVKMINFKMYGSKGCMMKFCSSECASHEQMSLEG